MSFPWVRLLPWCRTRCMRGSAERVEGDQDAGFRVQSLQPSSVFLQGDIKPSARLSYIPFLPMSICSRLHRYCHAAGVRRLLTSESAIEFSSAACPPIRCRESQTNHPALCNICLSSIWQASIEDQHHVSIASVRWSARRSDKAVPVPLTKKTLQSPLHLESSALKLQSIKRAKQAEKR